MNAQSTILIGVILVALRPAAAQLMITTQPQSQSVRVGQTVSFTVTASSFFEPYHYQWQHNDVDLPDETKDILTLTNVQLAYAGRYTVVVTDGFEDVTTSAPARLTVSTNDTQITLLHDTWDDGDRVTGPVSPSNSVWYTSAGSSLLAQPNAIVGVADVLEPRLWVGYFTEEAAGPVDLAIGQMIRVTLVFTPTNVASQAGAGMARGLRFGLFNYADGGTRLGSDHTFDANTGNGVNVQGYMVNQNFYTNFSESSPMRLRVRSNPGSDNLMGNNGDYLDLGDAQADYQQKPGFFSGTTYRLEFSVFRGDTNSVDIIVRITGRGLALSLAISDTSASASHRFDAFAFRPNSASTSAESFTFSEFKVEVLDPPALSPSFTPILTGPLVTESDYHIGAGWGDYDNDGSIDLFIGNLSNNSIKLFHNEGHGAFSLVSAGPIAHAGGPASSAAWADYDNDGLLDLVVACGWENDPRNNYLFRNRGGGAFEQILDNEIVNDGGQSTGCAWGDYNNDGYLDLFVANGFGGQVNFLYRNDGGETFFRIFPGQIIPDEIVTDLGDFSGGSWGDYDNDGDPDMFASSWPPYNDAFYRNNGDGTFTKVIDGEMVNESGSGNGSAWGDYNNDGYLDLFVANALFQNNWLYRNNGNGTFTKILEGDIANDGGNSQGCAWGDYDNDGWLDLFVGNAAWDRSRKHFIYHNNSDGTFTRIINAGPITAGGNSIGGAWGDYDNDGFLDLIVPNGAQHSQQNFLYHNNGNTNRWLAFKLVGAASNRSAIGAKIRLKAVIKGASLWQMREVSAGNGFGIQSDDLRPHFGLGDAANVDLVRVEWPSGTVQELRDVAVNQFLTVKEPPMLTAFRADSLGVFPLRFNGGPGLRYNIEYSTNLIHWNTLTNLTTTKIVTLIRDVGATSAPSRFYRAREVD